MSIVFMWHESRLMTDFKLLRDSWVALTVALTTLKDVLGHNVLRKSAFKKYVDEHKIESIVGLTYIVWAFVGFIASSQWPWFFALILMSIAGHQIVKRLSFDNFCIFKYIDGTISIAILVWVSWNHFHN